MIFDYILTLNSNEIVESLDYQLEEQLKNITIYRKVIAESFKYSNKRWFAVGYGRGEYRNNIIKRDEISIFIIGECFSRIDSSYFGESRKLSANDIYSLYIKKKNKLVDEIKGNFQIVLIENDQIILVNSRSGVSPFYYCFDNDKFICSTAIYLFPKQVKNNLKFSEKNILEYAIFNYPLGENTLFKNVYNLLPGEIITYKNGKLNREKYYDVADLITEKRISVKEAIEKGNYLFKKIVNTFASDKEYINASLTGGFDGRTILSVLDYPKKNLLLYSFGIKGSYNISIPIEISKDLGYNFKPYYLDEDYAESYPFYAEMTCLLTDCLATVQRANYLYVFEDLAKHSDVVITGIFGSELMRTFQNAGLMISIPATKTLLSDDPLKQLEIEIDNYPYKNYWGENIFNNENKTVVIESWKKKYLDRNYLFKNQFIFTYFIKDALRKYFGGEVHAERIFATNRFPFFDDEFVELILQSPFSAINNTFLKPTIKERLNSQIYYAHIMKRNNPKLLNYTTDHGFAPKYLFYPFSTLFVGFQVYIRSKIRKWKNYKEFNAEEWAQKLFDTRNIIDKEKSFVNVPLMLMKIKNGEWKETPEEIKKAYSLQLYQEFFL
jgi:hypothetical protein